MVYCVGKWQGWGQFNSGIRIAAQFQCQFRNWNWNWWNWKWNLNWKLWNWNWKLEIFLQLRPQHLHSMEQQRLGCNSVTGWEFNNLTFLEPHGLWQGITSVRHQVTLWYANVCRQVATEQGYRHGHFTHCHIPTGNQFICSQNVVIVNSATDQWFQIRKLRIYW